MQQFSIVAASCLAKRRAFKCECSDLFVIADMYGLTWGVVGGRPMGVCGWRYGHGGLGGRGGC